MVDRIRGGRTRDDHGRDRTGRDEGRNDLLVLPEVEQPSPGLNTLLQGLVCHPVPSILLSSRHPRPTPTVSTPNPHRVPDQFGTLVFSDDGYLVRTRPNPPFPYSFLLRPLSLTTPTLSTTPGPLSHPPLLLLSFYAIPSPMVRSQPPLHGTFFHPLSPCWTYPLPIGPFCHRFTSVSSTVRPLTTLPRSIPFLPLLRSVPFLPSTVCPPHPSSRTVRPRPTLSRAVPPPLSVTLLHHGLSPSSPSTVRPPTVCSLPPLYVHLPPILP